MKRGSDNSNLRRAKKVKNDEYYTRMEDIEQELQHYSHCLEDKVVYLICDNPEFSNFYRYFVKNFKKLKLRELIATYYNPNGISKKTVVFLNEEGALTVKVEPLEGDGDFRSEECVEVLKHSDIIITNPPFSLWRALLDLLIRYQKDYLIIGPLIALSYLVVFGEIKARKMTTGVNEIKHFNIAESFAKTLNPDQFKRDENGNPIKDVSCLWYTNMPYKEQETLKDEAQQPTLSMCDNEDILNIDKLAHVPLIPSDYEGLIAAPITILKRFPFEDFELLYLHGDLYLNNKKLFKRVIFKRRGENDNDTIREKRLDQIKTLEVKNEQAAIFNDQRAA